MADPAVEGVLDDERLDVLLGLWRIDLQDKWWNRRVAAADAAPAEAAGPQRRSPTDPAIHCVLPLPAETVTPNGRWLRRGRSVPSRRAPVTPVPRHSRCGAPPLPPQSPGGAVAGASRSPRGPASRRRAG